TCKHIVAVLLEIADQKQYVPLSDHITSAFMDGLLINSEEDIHVLSDKVPMHVEYTLKLDYNHKVWLEWKTGVDHYYVVRNVREFLYHVMEQEPHFFTKKFTFDPNHHYFLQQEEEIFEMLMAFIDTGDLFTDHGYFTSAAYDKRSLLIPTFALKGLLEKLEHRD